MDKLLDQLIAEAILTDYRKEKHAKVAYNALLDYMQEQDIPHTDPRIAGKVMPPELYGWQSPFEYAGEKAKEGYSTYGEANVEPAMPGLKIDCSPFDRKAVKRVIKLDEGENDGPSWLCVGELWDGRFFALEAGCDYTGWG